MPGTYTKLLYHLVFSTKNRLPLIKSEFEDELRCYFAGIVVAEQGSLLEVGGVADHVHSLIQLKPVVSVSEFVRTLKSNSSKWLNERFELQHRFAWQDGYAAFSVSESQVSRVRAYIQDQAGHHRQIDFKSELYELLKRHRIEFEERFLV